MPVNIVVLIERWAKEKGFYAYYPLTKSFVNVSLTESAADYVTMWPENGKVKFIYPVGKHSLDEKILLPADPEFFTKLEKLLLSCLTQKK